MSVDYQVADDVAVITLDRPEVFNSIDQAISDGLVESLGRAGREARAAVVTGAGKAFCAGADLSGLMAEYEADGPDLERLITRRFNPAVEAVMSSQVPVIAAVNGAAAGAGMGLALACDIRVMADNAFFMSAFVNVALIPDTGSAWLLPQMVGLSRAMEIAMSGRRVPATEALDLGLAVEVVPPESLLDVARSRARAMADGPRRAYVETRRLLMQAAAASFEATLGTEAVTQGELGALPTHLEGMRAFVEKRKPDFRSVE